MLAGLLVSAGLAGWLACDLASLVVGVRRVALYP